MPEAFLYFIWQYQYFVSLALTTTDGERLRVLHPGFRNNHAGPDFTNARLFINDVEWIGTVEMHPRTSDWLVHQHQHDRAYDNVILHVVWQDDRRMNGRRVDRANGTPLPTLELSPLTDATLLTRYQTLTDAPDAIPCAPQFREVSPLRITSMLDKAMLQRLERKAGQVRLLAEQTNNDWEEVAYRLLAINLGFKVNAEPMEQLSRAVPLKMILKHRDNLLQVEAMLFGTAGLLAVDEPDAYTMTLQREYQFLAAKYDLSAKRLQTHHWKWGRLRPANFPTIRLAQLSRLLTYHTSLFSLFVGTDEIERLINAFQVQPSEYWQTHYRFGKATEKGIATLGQSSAVTLIINTIAPLLAAYAHHRGQPAFIDRAVRLLEELPAEKNSLLDEWDALGLGIRTAFDSQAAIELYNEFCSVKKCLNCQIGASLIRKK